MCRNFFTTAIVADAYHTKEYPAPTATPSDPASTCVLKNPMSVQNDHQAYRLYGCLGWRPVGDDASVMLLVRVAVRVEKALCWGRPVSFVRHYFCRDITYRVVAFGIW